MKADFHVSLIAIYKTIVTYLVYFVYSLSKKYISVLVYNSNYRIITYFFSSLIAPK